MKLLGTAENLPFRGNRFDYVVSITALHNFKDIKKSINEMKRVGRQDFVFSILRKSGKFPFIKASLEKGFIIEKAVEEQKDTIFFCKKFREDFKNYGTLSSFLIKY